MEFIERHVLAEHPEYFSCLDEFRMPDGGQMLVIHLDVDPLRFTPEVYKRIQREFWALRSCTDAPWFAFEPEPDDVKWERFVRPFNYSYCGRATFPDGQSRRFFLSVPNNEQQNHADREPEWDEQLAPPRGADGLPLRRLEPSAEPIQ